MTVSLKPRVSEKAYGQSQALNTYVFDIKAGVSRQQVAKAVEEQFKVSVTAVRLAGLPGKRQRTVRRGRIAKPGYRPAVRKAYVSLKKGDSLPFFADSETGKKAKAKAKEQK